MSAGGTPVGRREVAVRCFAAEYDDASLEYSESDEERAPNYVVTPTGARINRLFVVGVLTEVEAVSDDVLRGRVVDPTGAFVVYAGQYQPEAKTALERAEPPTFVAVTGKARTFEPDDGDRVYTSIRPESINVVDAETRDRWTVQTAEHTLERVATFADALEREDRDEALTQALVDAGIGVGLAHGIPRAIDHYGTTPAYLAAVRELALQAAAVVAGERDEVDPLDLAPDAGGAVESDLGAGVAVEATAPAATSGEAAGSTPTESAGTTTAASDAETGEAGEVAETGTDVEAATAGTDDVEEPVAGSPTTERAEASTEADDLGDFDDYQSDDEPAGTTAEAGGDERPETDGVDEVDGKDEADEADGADGADDAQAEAEAEAAPGSGGSSTDELYEMGDAEREAVEEEFGTEFSTGSEVGEPGDADIETPEPPEETATDDEPADVEPSDADPDVDESVDLVDAAVAAMDELDEGDGAERTAVIESVVDEYGVDAEAVEDAISDALMGGRCYEPEDGRLKAI